MSPADGSVVAAVASVPENRIENGRLVYPGDMPDDPQSQMMGNHVVIDHGNGEFSHFSHLQVGSLLVRPGDRVRRGQRIATIGFSGDTGMHVHLHYDLKDGPDFQRARALPAYFSGFDRLLGSRTVKVDRSPVDTGDLVVSK